MSKQCKPRITCIYKITNPEGLVYVGQSRDMERRLHMYSLGHCKSQRKLYNSIKKYGWQSHTFEIIILLEEECPKDVIDQHEVEHIKKYAGRTTSLNLMEGGHKGKHSPESIEKIIAWKIGRPLSEEQKRNIGNGNRGKVYSAETCKKISDAKKGKKLNLTEEQRYKRGVGSRRPRSSETKEKMKQAATKRWATMSEEKRHQHKKSLTGRVFSEQHIQNLSKAQKETQRKKMEAKNKSAQNLQLNIF